jgi:mRNA-degrading endonuclease RelE of RelBE toxin-antitoxin system
MEFRIADTFIDSLSRLTAEEQKAVKTTAFDLQVNPAHPALQFHKLEKPKDQNFWSIRVSSDIRLIVHRTQSSVLLCYVNHHDDAYQWAERRRLEAHPKTGAAQLVEMIETVREIVVPKYVDAPKISEKATPFLHIPDSTLLGYGIPPEWLDAVHHADEDSILTIALHLPAEAAEAALDLAVGVVPKTADRLMAGADPFTHPDAQRRFRTMRNVDELERALDYPWEKWIVFLHPSQRQLVERKYNGPARVSGSAGTGKTIVALHRAVELTRSHPNTRVLLTTFSETLANALHGKLRCLISNEPRLAERLEIHAIDAIGQRLYELNIGRAQLAPPETIPELLAEAVKASPGNKFSAHFLLAEWRQIVDPWQLATWESYRDVSRLGRKSRLNEAQRAALWAIFERVRAGLKERGLITRAEMFTVLAANITKAKQSSFDFTIVDEAQDLSVPQLRFLAALGVQRPDGLFFAGDLGQRIFQPPFSWKSLGVDVRGRGSTLKINYRTSQQIRVQADLLLGPEISDVDGNSERRKGTISLFNGPPPDILTLDSNALENNAVGVWLKERAKEGVTPHEIGVFVRSEAQIPRAVEAAKLAGIPFKILDKNVQTTTGYASICTMHLAKGLEFRVVAVMACDDKVIPLQERIETVADDSELDEVYNTERHLLYVACTRARDRLLVTATKPASEFLDDLRRQPMQKES